MIIKIIKRVKITFFTKMASRKTKFVLVNHLLQFHTDFDEVLDSRNQSRCKAHSETRFEARRKEQENKKIVQVKCRACRRRYRVLPKTTLHAEVVKKKGTWFIDEPECPHCWMEFDLRICCGLDQIDSDLSDDDELGEDPGLVHSIHTAQNRLKEVSDPDNKDPDPFRGVQKALNSFTRQIVQQDEEKLERGSKIREMLGEEIH